MIVIDPYDMDTKSSKAAERTLIAWENICGLPEVKAIITHKNKMFLGGKIGHSHPYKETYILAHGNCVWYTWSKEKGQNEIALTAPCLFVIEPDEEHAVIADKDMVLIGLLPQKFEPGSHVDAVNLVLPENI